MENPGVRPCERNWNQEVNPTINVQNWFFHFSGHGSTLSSEYNLSLLTKNPIKWEDKQRNFFHCLWKFSPCLYVFYFSHRSRSVFIGSLLWVSQYGSPSMTSMMVSVLIYHNPRMRTSPLVSNTPLLWHTSSSDLLHPWWIRGSPLTQLGQKYNCAS